MNPIRLWPWQIWRHEFRRSSKILVEDFGKDEIFLRLMQSKRSVDKKIAGYFTVLLVGPVWISDQNSQLLIPIPKLGNLEIPSIYLTFLVALCVFGFVSSLIELHTFRIAKRVIINHGKQTNYYSMYVFPFENYSSWIDGTMPSSLFFKQTKYKVYVVYSWLLIALTFLFLPLVIATYKIVAVTISYQSKPIQYEFQTIVALLTWMVLALSFLQLVAWITPTTVSKNKNNIRYLFLFRIYKRQNLPHPRFQHWVEEK